jgi:probable HAF family extracellular repeat protein
MSQFITLSSVPPFRTAVFLHRCCAVTSAKRTPGNRLTTSTLLRIAALLISAVLVGAGELKAQTRYEVKAVPTGANLSSVVLGINQHGDVTGYTIEGNVYRGFLLRADSNQPEDLGNLGGQLTAGCAINDRRQVTGYSQDSYGNLNAFLYTENEGIRSLGTLGGTSEAFGLNSSGTAVGDCSTGNYQHVPTVFGHGNVQDLGLAGGSTNDILQTAFGINDSNTVVGRRELDNGTTSGFVYSVQNNQATDLGTLGGQNSEALAINKKGEIVGDSEAQDGITHAFFYTNQLQDLGFLPGYNQASYARAINDNSQIVGESDSSSDKHAFLFSHGQFYDLNSLAVNLSPAGFRSLDVAYGINNNGVIVGYGTSNDGRTIGFIAYPQGERKPLVTNTPSAPSAPSDQGDTYAVFYSRLRDDGDWVESGGYGYCFHPRVARGDWYPYRDGHWVWTDRGWFWDSNEDFGWACYHYGRWALIAGVGWCWVPGHQWAPAWVCWRHSRQYCGWAPLPPDAGFDPNFRIESWSDSYYGLGPQNYIFIPYTHFSDRSYTQWVVPPQQNVTIIPQTTNITNIYSQNNIVINNGPPVDYVSQRIGQTIQPTRIVFNQQPQAQRFGTQLQGNQLQVIAPAQTLRAISNVRPTVVQQIPNPVIQRGWQNVPQNQATQLRQAIAQQNPVPQNLHKPAPVPTPQFVAAAATPSGSPVKPGGSPSARPTGNLPPGLLRPGTSPHPNLPPNVITPSPTGKPGTAGSPKINVPPNLIAPTAKPGTTPTGSPRTDIRSNLVSPAPTAKPGTTPPPKTNVPPNLVSPAPTGKPVSTPAPKPTSAVQPNLQPNVATPAAKPTPERTPISTPKPVPTPENTPHHTPTPALQNATPIPTPHQTATPEERKLQQTPPPAPHKSATPTQPKPQERKPTSTPQPQAKAAPVVHQRTVQTSHVEQSKPVQHQQAAHTVQSKPPSQPHVQAQPPSQPHVEAKPAPQPHVQSKPPPPPAPHQEQKKGAGGKPTPKK